MRLTFAQVRQCRELVEVVRNIEQVRGEIAALESDGAAAESPPGGAPSAPRSLREAVARNELAPSKYELERLLTRAEQLALAISEGDPAMSPSPRRVSDALSRGEALAALRRSASRSPLRLAAVGFVSLALVASFGVGAAVGNALRGNPLDRASVSDVAFAQPQRSAEAFLRTVTSAAAAALPAGESSPALLGETADPGEEAASWAVGHSAWDEQDGVGGLSWEQRVLDDGETAWVMIASSEL